MRRNRMFTTGLVACHLFVFMLTGFVEAGTEKETARTIHEAAGVKAGLMVHLGCGGGGLTAELARSGRFLVHGLSTDEERIAGTRETLQAHGLYGLVSVEYCSLGKLPYVDDLVNLVVADDLPRLLKAGLSLKEIMRVVCPNGVALLGQQGGHLSEADLKAQLIEAGIRDFEIVGQNGIWARIVKPRPKEMDEWPEHLHGPDRNPVSHDRLVEFPSASRWIAGPVWPRGHRKNSTLSAVSANGRNFYYTVNSPSNMNTPPQERMARDRWYLVARDAYNGAFLWEQPWEYGSWWKSAYGYYGGTIALAAAGDRVFAAVKKNHATILDAGTGRILGSCELNSMPQEMAYIKNHLITRTETGICSVDPEEGVLEWNVDAKTGGLVATDTGVFFLKRLNGGKGPGILVGLNAATGREKWHSEASGWVGKTEQGRPLGVQLCWYQAGVLILVARDRSVHAVSAEDGRHLWKTAPRQNFWGAEKPMFIDGLVWVPRPAGELRGRRSAQSMTFLWEGLDPTTGKVRKSIEVQGTGGSCGRPVATDRFLIWGKYITFAETKSGRVHKEFRGTVGPCSLHPLPANGLLYCHPAVCGCFFVNRYAVRGFIALASEPTAWAEEEKADAEMRLAKGPAYDSAQEDRPSGAARQAGDWPTYRHDPARSGCASTEVATDLKLLWSERLAEPYSWSLSRDWLLSPFFYGELLSAPVVAGGMVIVAVPDAHSVVALDADTGKHLWRFVAGARVDSPPAVEGDLCHFGAKNGWVYCLNAKDGRLVWRFRVAPAERRIMAFGQLESPWPVSGNVLVDKDIVLASAGRSGKLDGGYWLRAIEARTGRFLWEKRYQNAQVVGQSILVSDGNSAYMGHYRFHLSKEGFKQAKELPKTAFLKGEHGLLSNSWRKLPTSLHRSQNRWAFGLSRFKEGDSRGDLTGFLLVFDDKNVYGYKEIRNPRRKGKVGRWGYLRDCELYARKREGSSMKDPALWTFPVIGTAQVESMLVAGKTLIAAGPTNRYTPPESCSGRIWMISTEDGKLQKEMHLESSPVFEGMAAANGRLYVATQDGRVLCFEGKQRR